MSIDQNTGAVLPDAESDDNMPVIFANLFGTISSMFVLRAASTSDRNSRFQEVPAGTKVVCAAEKTEWLKLFDTPASVPAGQNLWWTIGQDIGWQSNQFTADSNGLWSVTSSWLCVRNGWVDFQMRVQYAGTDQINPTNRFGDVGNSTVGRIPSSFGPKDFAALGQGHIGAGAWFSVQNTGAIQLSSLSWAGGDNINPAYVGNGDSFSAQGAWALGVTV